MKHDFVETLNLSVLTRNDGGGFKRSVPSRGWWRTVEITLEGEHLVCGPNYEMGYQLVEDGASGVDILYAFLKLAENDTTSDQIVNFARRYGTLELCQHHLPRTHWDVLSATPDTIRQPRCVPLSCSERVAYSWEPIEDWKTLARGLRAVLQVAAPLHQDQPASLEAWKAIFAMGTGSTHCLTDIEQVEHLSPTDRLKRHRTHLVRVINWLLQMANVRPWFWWSDADTRIGLEFGGPEESGLFGHLILQLVLVVSQKDGFAFCTECGRVYLPTRRPARNRSNYCETCKKASIPQQKAALRYWRKTGRLKRKKEQSKRRKFSSRKA